MTDRELIGLHHSLSRHEYEQIDAANFSTLKHFDRSAAHAHEYILHPKEPTDAMELGTAVHMAILEPERFASAYTVAPKVDRRTKEGKAEWAKIEADNPGRSFLSTEEYEQCNGMMKAVESHPFAHQLIYGQGRNEISCIWKDEATGVLCKSRMDRFTSAWGYSVVLDIKSTGNAQEGIFKAQAARMLYHVQAAFYLDGLNTLAPLDRRFLTLVIERERPHGIQIFEMDDEALSEGRSRYRSFLRQYKACKETNNWPGYVNGIQPLALPKWAMNRSDGGE